MIAEVVNNFPLVNYVQSKGAKELKKNEYLLTCPACGKEKLTINVSKKLWHCWTCAKYTYDSWTQSKKVIQGAGGVLQLVMLFEKMSLSEAVEFVTRYSTYQIEKLLSFVDFKLEEKTINVGGVSYPKIDYPEYSVPLTTILPFMKLRGISGDDAINFRLFTCSSGRYGNRLIFPVYDHNNFICFQGRAMWQAVSGVKYIKALAPAHVAGNARTSDVLFNLDQAASYPRVFIAEGPISAIHGGYAGVCTFGKRMTVEQIKYLIKYKVKAIDLCWDGPGPTESNGAYVEMLLIAPMLAQLFDVRIVLLPSGDPGDYSTEEINAFRAKSVHYSEKLASKNNIQKV